MNARLIAALSLAAVASAGCVDSLVPVEFYGMCAFPDDAVACQPPAGTCDRYQNGRLYLYYQGLDSLDMVAEFHNQRTDNTDVVPGGVNTANAQITEYRYTFTASPALSLSSRTLAYLTTPIAAGGTSTLWVPVLPSATVAELRATAGYQGTLSVEITPRGRYGDGTTFEVGSFTVPVEVLTGAPPVFVCPDPADTPTFCPSQLQTSSVTCGTTNTFDLGGTVTGLTNPGLVLASPGLANVTVTSGSTTFSFGSVPDGTVYDVTVQAQPTGQTCTVTNGSGTVSGAAVANIQVTCI